VSNDKDGIYCDLEAGVTLDLDDLFQAQEIRAIIFDIEEEEFYVLCNERNGESGFFLIKFEDRQPKNFVYLTMWRNNLEIGDANMFISRGTNQIGPYKELICGFKTISINTYTTMVIDLSQDSTRGRQTLAKHEGF
jgi:hypothetical protein